MFPVGSFVSRKPETYSFSGNFWVSSCHKFGQPVNASYKVTYSSGRTLRLEGFDYTGFSAEHFVASFIEPLNLDKFM